MSPVCEGHRSTLIDIAGPSGNTCLSPLSGIDIGTIHYEISGICNAKCTYCPTGVGVTKGYASRFIPTEEFARGLNRLYELDILNNSKFFGLYNWGDPLLHPKLDEILTVLNEADQSFALSTNGSYIPKNLNPSLLDNLSHFRLSLPGFSQESYDKIHQLNFEKVLNNIDLLTEIVPPNTLEVAIFAYQFNADEISEASEYFNERNIRFQSVVPHLMDYEDAIGYLTDQMDPIRKQKIENDLYTDYIKPMLLHRNGETSCKYLRNQLVIDEYSNILTCCVLSKKSEHYNVGSLFELTKEDIFNIKTQGRPICQECSSAGVFYWYDHAQEYLPRDLKKFNSQTICCTQQSTQLDGRIQLLQQTVADRDAQVASLNEEIQQQAARLTHLSNELASIKQSIVWRLLMKYHNGFIEKILPQNTRRRAIYDLGLKDSRILVNKGLRCLSFEAGQYYKLRTDDDQEHDCKHNGPQ